jgi:hypothetical protein
LVEARWSHGWQFRLHGIEQGVADYPRAVRPRTAQTHMDTTAGISILGVAGRVVGSARQIYCAIGQMLLSARTVAPGRDGHNKREI